MGRSIEIDVAKGIGIILVIVGHLSRKETHSIIYLFHMPLFFFVSGMFYNYKKNYISYRAKHIILPFFIFILVSFPFKFIERCILQQHIYFNLSYFTIQFNNIPLWFCWALFAISCLYHAIVIICKKKSHFIISCFFFSTIGFLLSCHNFELPLYLSQSFLAFPFYVLGHLLGNYNMVLNRLGQWGCIISASIILYALIYDIQTDIGGLVTDKNPVFFYAPAVAGIYIILFIAKKVTNLFIQGCLSYLGRNSLIIFGLHWPFITIFQEILLYFNIHPIVTNIIVFPIILLLSLFIGYILSIIFPKIYHKNELLNICEIAK